MKNKDHIVWNPELYNRKKSPLEDYDHMSNSWCSAERRKQIIDIILSDKNALKQQSRKYHLNNLRWYFVNFIEHAKGYIKTFFL